MKPSALFNLIADNRNPNSFASRLRKGRFALFLLLLSRLDSPVTILDIRGTQEFWKLIGSDLEKEIKITLLNLSEQAVSNPSIKSVLGDARDLRYPNNSFDVVFSNSVIEHVGDFENQMRMAEEIKRVGKRYYVQTPNRHFFIEPHFLFPYFQFLPIQMRMWLVMNFNLGWFKREPNTELAHKLLESITLLSKNELLALFPGSNIYEEKILGLTKSFVVYSGWELNSLNTHRRVAGK